MSDPTFSTAPGQVPDSSPGDNPDDPPGGANPVDDSAGGGSAGSSDPTGTLPFTGFHLTEIALAALASVALGSTLTWRNRRRVRA